MQRDSKEYRLAEKIVHLQDALNQSNSLLNKDGNLGVIPNHSVSFRESQSFHKKVRKVLDEN